MRQISLRTCFRTALLGLSMAAGHTLHAQTISTVAGNGTNSFSGDGGSALSATVGNTFGVITDTAGNIYIGDASNNRVRKISKTGIITTIAGTGPDGYGGDGGPASGALMGYPSGLSMDAGGNLYIADPHNSVIRKIDPSGVISTFAGIAASGYSGDGGPATNAEMTYADGVFADKAGNVYFPDANNHRIRKVDAAGIITTIAGNGTTVFSGDGGPATAAGLYDPTDVVADDAGNVYFPDYFHHRIRKIDASGTITTICGTGTIGYTGDGGAATAATIYNPVGIALDNCGNVYFADKGNHRVRKISTSGIVTSLAGTSAGAYTGDGMAATASALYYPHGVHLDKKGNIYIADRFNYRIRKIATLNRVPYFQKGAYDTVTLWCTTGGKALSTDLAVIDSNMDQDVDYSVATAPKHGSLTGFPASFATTGGVITPTGLTYTPTLGYIGTDTFFVSVADCFETVTIPVYVNIMPKPYTGVIAGIDSVCPGKKVTLTTTGTGGAWSSVNPAKGSISTTGVLTGGLTTGKDTIRYISTTACGSDTATYIVKVRTLAACIVGVEEVATTAGYTLTVSPNPAKGTFRILLNAADAGEAQIIITNILGAKVKELTISNNKETEIQLHTAPGVYFISSATPQGRITTRVLLTE